MGSNVYVKGVASICASRPHAIQRYICEAQLAKTLLQLWQRLWVLALPVLALKIIVGLLQQRTSI